MKKRHSNCPHRAYDMVGKASDICAGENLETSIVRELLLR